MVNVMTENERISAFMDNQGLDSDTFELLSDKKNAKKWKAYHLIGDVMRGDIPQQKEWDIVDRVAMALESEQVYQIDSKDSITDSITNDVVTEFIPQQPTVKEAKRTLPRWLTQFGQVAVGACFSLAIIVGVQQYNMSEKIAMTDGSNDVQVLDTVPFSGSAEPVSLTADSFLSKSATPSESNVMEQRKRINAMLQDYELQLRLNMHDGSIDTNLL